MRLYEYDSLAVRTLENSDEVLLAKWLSNPVVLEYYEGRDRPHDIAMVREGVYSENENEIRCIVEYDRIPIGYIQFYTVHEETREDYGYSDFPGVIFGMDQYIGEVQYWGKGIGKLLVKSMLHYLTSDKKAGKVILDPQCWNLRAIACYKSCGFVEVKLLPAHELHEGEWRDSWLMEYEPL
jgi:aminoglycoside 6'-N-acetyltransferase